MKSFIVLAPGLLWPFENDR